MANAETATPHKTPRRYAVFLSYRHTDNNETGRQWATWLHQMLEGYEVPADLVGTPNARGESIPPSLYPVFRDEEELPADADLTRNIRQALEHSNLLVVLCSPGAVASRFVAEEIRYFKELGHADAILALIIDGEPNAADDPVKNAGGIAAELECLPQPLRCGVAREDGSMDWKARTEPIAADVRPGGRPVQGWTTGAAYREQLASAGRLDNKAIEEDVRQYEQRLELAKLKIIAGALAVPLGNLTKRDKAMQLAKARKRARTLRRWLVVVIALGLAALCAGVLAYRNQKEAARQRDRALLQVYRNTIRLAAEKVTAGDFYKGRQLLLTCARQYRKWEWWFLMARCGPAAIPLNKLSAMGDPVLAKAAAAMKVRLDRSAADDRKGVSRISSNDRANAEENHLILEYEKYRGRGGTTWHAWRGAGKTPVLLAGYYTGMYGGLPAALLESHDTVYWRLEAGEERSYPMMADGEPISQAGDYLASIRERYIVGDLGNTETAKPPNLEHGHVIDTRTWADDSRIGEEANLIALDVTRSNVVFVGAPDADKGRRSIDLDASTVKNIKADASKALIPLSRLATLAALPSDEALKLVQDEKQALPEAYRAGHRFVVENGAEGPLILTTWNAGNVRLRNGSTGRIIGESSNPARPSTVDGFDMGYGGRVTIIPGTNLIAGWFWWRNKAMVGVLDIEKAHVVCHFEKADAEMVFAYEVQASITAAPDGSEVAFELVGRNEHLFSVWNLKSGKLVYRHSDIAGDEGSEKATNASAHLPGAYAWHPGGRFVAICRPAGITELRHTFATPPFAFLEGVVPSRNFCVQEVGDASRVVVGNAVVDTATWETVITIPTSNRVSRDGNLAVVETRRGVVDVVRLALRQASHESQSATPLRLPEKVLLHQIREHDDRQPTAKLER